MLERPSNAQIELVLLEGFEDVVVSPGPDRFERDRDVVHGRHHDDRDVRIVLPQFGKQFEPVHFRHHDVAQYKIERIAAETLEREPAVRARGTAIALRFQ